MGINTPMGTSAALRHDYRNNALLLIHTRIVYKPYV
jgi:hypothetical protein